MAIKNAYNSKNLALNRFDDGNPKEMWFTEGQDFVTSERKNSPYDVNIFKVITKAIEEGLIVISAENLNDVDIQEGDRITITGSGTTVDPWIITADVQTMTATEIIDAINAEVGYSSWINEAITLLDEDDFTSDSDTQGATQQSIKAYVDAQVASGGVPFIKQKLGKAKLYARQDTVAYTLSNGVATFEIDNFGDISELNLIIDRADDAVSGQTFELIIKYLDNAVNTWDPASGNNPEDHDLYIPQYRIYDATLTIPLVARQEFVDASSGNAQNPIVPKFEFGNGEVRFKFDNSIGPWMATNRIMIQLQFARI